ncbi:hypothetical protein N431DRAFT_519116 [Stipitochalara longipes BDJ]|nr:hypothetical protein N431DRAFT_519116 [Stipitochalara longipes BDJ]
MESTSEAGQLVRSYSIELESNLPATVPDNDLRRIFIENERRIQVEEQESAIWRSYYEPWSPGDETTHAWKVFRTTLPKTEQEELEGKIPTVEGLIGMVDTVAKEWQSKRVASQSGKFIKHFIGFCKTLDAHSAMLEVLPDGNEYVSLFTGTLKSIIHAASNYEKIASGLGKALSKISVHVVACEREVMLHPTKAVQEKVALLYAHVFLFLEDTMKWYQKKPRLKLRDSFRENFYDHFEETIINIQDLSRDVLREANLSSMAETRHVRLTTDDTIVELRLGQIDSRLSMDGVSRGQADIKHQLEQLRLDVQKDGEERRQLELNGPKWIEDFRNSLFSQIASGVRQELLGVAQKALEDMRLSNAGTCFRPLGRIENLDTGLNTAQFYERDSIILDSNHLLDMFSPTSLEIPYSPPYAHPISLETIASSRLKDWTTNPQIKFLSIAGRHSKGLEPPPMKILASMCVNFATNAKLPAISYFCSLPPVEELRGDNTREVQELISLTYALIRQFVELLPVQFSSDCDFTQERLSLLEGTSKSWTDAIELLRDLVISVPKPVFCIVDSFQVLDDWSTESMIGDFVKTLKDSGPEEETKETLKVLITTTGKSKALTRYLAVRELVLADRDGAVNSPARRGGTARLIL